jgi:hypothetical protein
MINKGFLRERMKVSHERNRSASAIIYRIMFWIGVLTLLVSLVYMLLHLNKADHILWIWIPLIVAGIVLIIVSQMNGITTRKSRKNQVKRT